MTDLSTAGDCPTDPSPWECKLHHLPDVSVSLFSSKERREAGAGMGSEESGKVERSGLYPPGQTRVEERDQSALTFCYFITQQDDVPAPRRWRRAVRHLVYHQVTHRLWNRPESTRVGIRPKTAPHTSLKHTGPSDSALTTSTDHNTSRIDSETHWRRPIQNPRRHHTKTTWHVDFETDQRQQRLHHHTETTTHIPTLKPTKKQHPYRHHLIHRLWTN